MAAQHNFTPAQAKRFNELQGELQRKQAELQKFVDFLVDEHSLDQSKQWQIGPQGFVEVTPAAGVNGTPADEAALAAAAAKRARRREKASA